jgi:hypothetical protein
MNTPTIPGLNAFPDLQRDYQNAYRQARLVSCGHCDSAQVVRRFTMILMQRQRLTVAPVRRPR